MQDSAARFMRGTGKSAKTQDPAEPERAPAESAHPAHPAETIFRLYGNAMFRAARRILPDDGEAEDAVMDALEKICASPEYFAALAGDERRMKLTVMRTTENAAIDRWRRRKRRLDREAHPARSDPDGAREEQRQEPEASGKDGIAESAEEAFFTKEEAEHCDFGTVGRAVRALPEKYREILLLRYGEEYGNLDIAAMLKIPASTVATRLMRAKEMLRKKLREGRWEDGRQR